MMIVSIAGRTRELGRGQGFIPLPVKDITISDSPDAPTQIHCMETAWQPTPEELARIIAGAPIILSIYGTELPRGSTLLDHLRAGSGHPPVNIKVGDVPDDG